MLFTPQQEVNTNANSSFDINVGERSAIYNPHGRTWSECLGRQRTIIGRHAGSKLPLSDFKYASPYQLVRW
eukprot:4697856-Pleurochrysis_carterae.AAC.1